jgi:hypothetical protein
MSHPATVEFASASRAGRWSARISHDGPVLALAFSPDGTRHPGNARGGQPLTEAVMIGISGTQGSPSSAQAPGTLGRVEDGRGGLGLVATPRFPSPLIKPDVQISRIRLSDWLHLTAHGGAPR